MLLKYIDAAMRKAHYKLLEDGSYFGEIPEFQGVQATAEMLAACRDRLEEELEDRIIGNVRKHLPLPIIDSIDINIKDVPSLSEED